ncbi:MAG: inner membrane CreD family protein, partial [Gaiellaceae bacterium]
MRSNVLVKMVLLAGLLFLLAIALLSIGGVIGERKNYRDTVIAEVARSSASEQTLVGPLLVIPYSEMARAEPGAAGTPVQARTRGERVLLPESLFISSSVRVEIRHRGIHRAQVFRASNQVSAIFQIPPDAGLTDATGLTSEGPSSLTFGVSDSRGLHRPPLIRWDGEHREPQPGSGLPWIAQGFSCDVGDLIATKARRVRVDIDLELIGTNQLSFVPVGASTRVEMNADWRDPSFVGTFLPDTRIIDGKGFRAGWELSR